METLRTSLASRTHFDVLGLGFEGQILSLEAWKSSKMSCTRLQDNTIFRFVEKMDKVMTIFFLRPCSESSRNFLKTFYLFYFGERPKLCGKFAKYLGEDPFFSLEEHLQNCVLGTWPWIFFCVLGLGLEPCVLDSTSDKNTVKWLFKNFPDAGRFSSALRQMKWNKWSKQYFSYKRKLIIGTI